MFTRFFSLFENMRGVETWACSQLDYWFSFIFKNLVHPKQVIAAISIMGQLLSFMISRTPIHAYGEELNLDGYELVFEDEFDGDELDLDVWRFRALGPTRESGYYSDETVSVHDGNLFIDGRWLDDGAYGPGWYASEIALKERYTYGYFEIRCICAENNGFWSCFWMQNPNSYDAEISRGGPGGSEIDILEANANNSSIAKGADAILHCVHVNGGPNDKTESSDTSGAVYFYGNNIYQEYNTYGVKWNEDEYIFYVNGVESLRTAWREGACREPEEVIVSVCIPKMNLDKLNSRDGAATMKVDYVRIYQQTEAQP